MKRRRSVLIFTTLLLLALLLSACNQTGTAAPEQTTEAPVTEPETAAAYTVTFYDSDGKTVLATVSVPEGEPLVLPELAKDGYALAGLYATPAMKLEFDPDAPITADTSVFVGWQSSAEDTRPWMLAGSFQAYPENEWGKIWPQDDFLLQPVEGEHNTFEIVVELHAGDAFKIAVIGEGYVWDNSNSIDAGHLADTSETAALSSGENAFDAGANIEVNEDGIYRLILTTDAENLSLCSLAYERLGDIE